MRNQRAPIFLEPLKGSTLSRGELSSQINDFTVLGLCGNKEGLVIVARERRTLILLYQSTFTTALTARTDFQGVRNCYNGSLKPTCARFQSGRNLFRKSDASGLFTSAAICDSDVTFARN